jgi:hypothetical protein
MVKIRWTREAPGIDSWTASSADEFVAAVRRSNLEWWESNRCPWVYRGHAELSWQLLPSAWRLNNNVIFASRTEAERRFDAVNPQQRLIWNWPPTNFQSGAATFGSSDTALARELAISTTAEILPVWDFGLTCNEMGLSIPLIHLPPDPAASPGWLWFPQLPLLADEFLNYSDLPAMLALAQHHGIPTRFLDWTMNPIAAAFFAVENILSPIAGESIVLWALNRQRADKVRVAGIQFPNGPRGAGPIDSALKVVRPPVRDNPYLAAQSGLFTTIAGSGIHFMQNNGERTSVENYVIQSNSADTILRKLVLPHEKVPALAEILEREKMSRVALMPTMDNAASDVMRRWSKKT